MANGSPFAFLYDADEIEIQPEWKDEIPGSFPALLIEAIASSTVSASGNCSDHDSKTGSERWTIRALSVRKEACERVLLSSICQI